MQNGKFVISLDFEIYWGVRDKKSIEAYRSELLGVRKVIPRLLNLFEKYEIQATFATVGLLFFDNKEEMKKAIPGIKPSYINKNLSPYYDLDKVVGETEDTDPYHFGKSLISQIVTKRQEIGSHTFCHYYCIEEGQTEAEFDADLEAAIKVADANNIRLQSFVFPRNQYNAAYLNILKRHGISSFRGNENSFFFDPSLTGLKLKLARALRLADTYINISGNNIYTQSQLSKDGIINIPASRFLRPFSTKLKPLEPLRLKRITRSMTAAAKSGRVYHLWWHPHNFGSYQDENFKFLEKILEHYQKLKTVYNFESINMGDLASQLLKQ
ncbi:MAG: polysaccharide deacetylase family protein [Chitinophagales bacterium]|nr:polysaccharide deacetylase family protein [Chitinophagales bacterium]